MIFPTSDLPVELLLSIFSYLSVQSLLQLITVSQEWRRFIISNKSLFRILIIKNPSIGSKAFERVCGYANKEVRVLELVGLIGRSMPVKQNYVSGLRCLVSLTLKNITHIPDATIETLIRSSRNTLQLLDMIGVPVSNATCAMALRLCVKLRVFNAIIPQISDAMVVDKINAPLESIDLSFNEGMTDKGMKLLASIKSLTSVTMKQALKVTLKSLIFLTQLKMLTTLIVCDIKGHAIIPSNDILLKLVIECTSMSTLGLSRCPFVNRESCAHMEKHAKNLKHLDISTCGNVDDESMRCLSNCTGLISLFISNCTRVSNEGVAHILEGCTQLRRLHMSGLFLVSVVSLDRISIGMNRISYLDISKCNSIKQISVVGLLTKRSPLVWLRINADSVSAETRDLLRLSLKLELV